MPPKVVILVRASLKNYDFVSIYVFAKTHDALTKITTLGGTEGCFRERFFKYLANVLSIFTIFEAHLI